jgi:DNA-binding MarR family transcriptional regulator
LVKSRYAANVGTSEPRDLVAEARRQWLAHGWSESATGMAAVISLMRAQQIVLSRLEDVVRPFGLSYARYEVLTLLSFTKAGELPLNKIGNRLQVRPPSVTAAVNKLEEQGLVERVPHPHDRRTTLARLTARGREMAEASTLALNNGPFAEPGIDRAQAQSLIQILDDLRRSAGDL